MGAERRRRLLVAAALATVLVNPLGGCSKSTDAALAGVKAAIEGPESQNDATSRWKIEDDTSQLDRSRTVGGVLASSNDVLNAIGRPGHAELVVACRAGDRKVGVAWPSYLGSEETTVRWKLDDGPIVNDRWQLTNDGENAVISGAAKTDALLKSLAHAQRMVVDATTYQTGPSEAVFDLQGVDGVVAKVEAACAPTAASTP